MLDVVGHTSPPPPSALTWGIDVNTRAIPNIVIMAENNLIFIIRNADL